ncbi:unnamed protein product, partial [Ixodes hexagonus]
DLRRLTTLRPSPKAMFGVTFLSIWATMLRFHLFPDTPLLHHYPSRLCTEPTRVLIVVKTYPSNHRLRQAIRETIGHKAVTSAFLWRVLFYMGNTEDKNTSQFLRKEIWKEDVFIAPYSAESSNVVMVFIETARWIHEKCTPQLEYLVHINDTTFPDLLALHEYIDKLDETDRNFHCNDKHLVPVGKHPTDSLYIPQTHFKDDLIPGYCESDAFVLKAQHLKVLVLASEAIPQYPLFGPYVTGHLTVLARLGHTSISGMIDVASNNPDWSSQALFVTGLKKPSLWKEYWIKRWLKHSHVTNVTSLLASKVLSSL